MVSDIVVSLRWIVTAIIVLFPISEGVLALFARARSRVVRRADDGSLRTLWLTIWISVTLGMVLMGRVAGFVFPVSGTVRDSLALVFLVSGLAFRWIAIVVLGRFFTVDVTIHEGHAVVDRGPYRYVRHPSYTGILVAFLGMGIYCGNWLSLAIIFIPITLAFLRRIETEERALLHDLGPAYAQYCSRTWRLVPAIY